MFTRTHRYVFSIPKELLQYRLIGNNISVRGLVFRVSEEDHALSILPYTEDRNSAHAFPATELQLEDDGNNTQVVITSSIRKVDSGLPLLLSMLCSVLLVAAVLVLYFAHEPVVAVAMCACTLLLLLFLFIHLQKGYFGYVRELHSYIKHTGDQITKDVRLQLFKHKAA